MTDTPPEVEARLRALFAERSGGERVRMTCEMFALARALMVSNIRAETPDISAADLRVEIFERTYGDDLAPEDRVRVIARLRL